MTNDQETRAYLADYLHTRIVDQPVDYNSRLCAQIDQLSDDLKALETAHETALGRIDELVADLDGKQQDLNILGRELYRLGQ